MATVWIDRLSGLPIIIFGGEIEAFGGGERGLIALSRWLHERGLPHQILLYYDAIHLTYYSDHPINVFVLNPERNPQHKIAMLRAYFDSEPHAAGPLMVGLQPALHAGLAGVRGFHTLMHDTPSLLGDPPRRIRERLRQLVTNRALRRGLNSGGTTIVNSEYVKAECQHLWHPPVEIVRMGGIAAKSFRPRVPGRQLRMLSVSRIEANKRIDWLLGALAELEESALALNERTDWVLDIVGGGSLIGPLAEMSRQLGLHDRVVFHDFVDDARLEAFYDQADLFLMPARQGYGIPAAEALSRGIPVLLHRESGISDILRDTPWATVMEGGQDRTADALDHAIAGVLSRNHLNAPLPDLPTEDDWAERVARICGWLVDG